MAVLTRRLGSVPDRICWSYLKVRVPAQVADQLVAEPGRRFEDERVVADGAVLRQQVPAGQVVALRAGLAQQRRQAVEWLTAQGVRFAPGGIRKGAAGFDICFLHPKANEEFPIGGEGVLIELVQAPPEVVSAFEKLAGQAG